MTLPQRDFTTIGLHVPTILLPRSDIDLTKWAVVACDQYTSQPEYWEKVATLVGDSPSTFHLILPEVYLDSFGCEKRIEKINHRMKEYLMQGVLVEQQPGFVLVDRKNHRGISRKGLMVALDLMQYDYTPDAKTLIRATEGTVIDRLPPRIQVRKKACLEIPHIMVLLDDPEGIVIEPLFDKKLPLLYDTPLMMGSGHVTGYGVYDPEIIREIADALERLLKSVATPGQKPMLYAIGDGNHSLAAAKALWENIKSTASPEHLLNHPARYALVELINIHDTGLAFEPIHRLLFNTSPHAVIKAMQEFYRRQGSGFHAVTSEDPEAVEEAVRSSRSDDRHVFGYLAEDTCGIITITNPAYGLETETLQVFLDAFLSRFPDIKIDYIHGSDAVAKLGSQSGNVGFYLPPINKHHFFQTIMRDGALPRKTFSLGEADDKRFYLECRKIVTAL